MNKAQLVAIIAAEAELTKTQAERALNAFTGTVTQTLANKDEVSLVGFGTFTTAERNAREGRNPQTGEPIQIAAATLPKFKAGKALKEALA
ncbi:hypothetical protein [Pseudoalteromonas phage KB12-38]|nr:hypothetical protein [Pseudoalteromonas phage KB12-38]